MNATTSKSQCRIWHYSARFLLAIFFALALSPQAFAIVFGSEVRSREKEATFTLALMKVSKNQAEYICSGILISQSLILTSSHCVADGATHVRFGANAFKNFFERPLTKSVQRSSRPIIKYNPSIIGRFITIGVLDELNIRDYDLAIYKFKGGLPNGFAPVKLAKDLPKGEERVFSTTGFGTVDLGSPSLSQGKLHITQSMIDLDTSIYHAKIRSVIRKEPEVGNSCYGDSGGPLISHDKNNLDELSVFGVTSSVGPGCLNGQSTYESIPFHYRWITRQIKNLETKAYIPES